jgi:hypothetical protein
MSGLEHVVRGQQRGSVIVWSFFQTTLKIGLEVYGNGFELDWLCHRTP